MISLVSLIVVDLRHVGTTAWLSEVLKISVRTSVSCAAQSFSTRLQTDRAPGRWEVWAVFVQVCHSAFQTVNKSG